MSKEKRLINSEIGDFYFLPSVNNDELILQPFIHLTLLLSLLIPFHFSLLAWAVYTHVE